MSILNEWVNSSSTGEFLIALGAAAVSVLIIFRLIFGAVSGLVLRIAVAAVVAVTASAGSGFAFLKDSVPDTSRVQDVVELPQ